jgi:LmbE family N-acetylglucosaminyl deacetylase
MDILKRWLIKSLGRRAIPYLKSHGLLKTIQDKPGFVWEPQGGRIVILAPHMDDEVLGCGGTLYKHALKGAEVTVVYMTDGTSGDKALKYLAGEERKRRQAELAEERKKEAHLAMETLGIKDAIFLDAPDGRLNSTDKIRKQLKQILGSIRPDLVYLPFFLEENPDHRATSLVLLDATQGTSFKFDCCGYEVWTPLIPNCLVEIKDVVQIKVQALQHYQSQLANNNYIHTSLGLNAYRSSALSDNDDSFVEAFFFTSLRDYCRLYEYYGQLCTTVRWRID